MVEVGEVGDILAFMKVVWGIKNEIVHDNDSKHNRVDILLTIVDLPMIILPMFCPKTRKMASNKGPNLQRCVFMVKAVKYGVMFLCLL